MSDTTLDGVRWRFSEGEHDDADVRWLLAEVDRQQVSTVEELAELPNMAALMGVAGRPSFYYWHAPSGKVIGYSGTEYAADVVLAGGPLTVVWRP